MAVLKVQNFGGCIFNKFGSQTDNVGWVLDQ